MRKQTILASTNKVWKHDLKPNLIIILSIIQSRCVQYVGGNLPVVQHIIYI